MKQDLTLQQIQESILITTNTLYNNMKRTIPKNSPEKHEISVFKLNVKDIVDGMIFTNEIYDDKIILKQDIFDIISELVSLRNRIKLIMDEPSYKMFRLNNRMVEALYVEHLLLLMED